MEKSRKKTVQFNLRLSPALRTRLERIARVNVRSLTQQIEYYIRQGLKNEVATRSNHFAEDLHKSAPNEE